MQINYYLNYESFVFFLLRANNINPAIPIILLKINPFCVLSAPVFGSFLPRFFCYHFLAILDFLTLSFYPLNELVHLVLLCLSIILDCQDLWSTWMSWSARLLWVFRSFGISFGFYQTLQIFLPDRSFRNLLDWSHPCQLFHLLMGSL